jgi:hypothetical protein
MTSTYNHFLLRYCSRDGDLWWCLEGGLRETWSLEDDDEEVEKKVKENFSNEIDGSFFWILISHSGSSFLKLET